MKLRLLLPAAALAPAVFIIFCRTVWTSESAACQVDLPAYILESCAAADIVFEAFSVCCEFLRRTRPPCLHLHLRAMASIADSEAWLGECCVLL
ncbi:hypothetical protein MUK42_10402 [Musa troglodytarum]|uniref:Uncharacterized protein n=1 Tax=Musa troglodytarum TaxID=320322 RepID=A0A9E7GL35_9LILI|nr:hypothetical protein MUK42_10402 [Musa troglodytarum]